MDEITKASEMIFKLFENLDRKDFERSNKINSAWKEILSKIKKRDEEGKEIEYGSFLYAHTRLVDLKKGILFIEADHSGWSQILQIYSSYIIKAINKKYPDLDIKSISIRLRTEN